MAITADNFDAAVLRRCFWPATNAPFTQTERLAIADEEILGSLYPKVIAAHADYYQTILDQPIVSGRDRYRLPMRTYGPLKDVSVVDSDGNEFSCALIDAEELGQGVWQQRYYGQLSGGGLSYSFYMNGDFLNLRPVPNTTANTLRIRYYRQPSQLTLETNARKIGSYDANTQEITTLEGTRPAAWIVGYYLDVINHGNAHAVIIPDAVISDVSGEPAGGVLFVAGTLPTDLGDETDHKLQIDPGQQFWLVGAGYSPIVQLPDFMQTAAIRCVAAACLEAHGDERGPYERAKADELVELAIETASPRVEGEPKFITTQNGPYRSGRVGGRGW